MKLARDGDIYFEIVFSNELNVCWLWLRALCTVCFDACTSIVHCTHFTFTLLIFVAVVVVFILSIRFSCCFFEFYTFQITWRFFSLSISVFFFFFCSNEWFMGIWNNLYGLLTPAPWHMTMSWESILETILNRIKRIETLKKFVNWHLFSLNVIALIAGCRLCAMRAGWGLCMWTLFVTLFSFDSLEMTFEFICLWPVNMHINDIKIAVCNLKENQIKTDLKESW